jgi:hypothetical protein
MAPYPPPVVCLYAAAAATVRGDEEAIDLMLDDLTEGFSRLSDVLLYIADVTLARLEEVPAIHDDRSGRTAREILTMAESFESAPTQALHAAAWRLELARGDMRLDDAHLRACRAIGSETELMRGAVALLAAIVCRSAILQDQAPWDAVTDLCLATSLTTV